MNNRIKDLTGQKFGKLTVINQISNYVFQNGDSLTQWLCKCDCGNYKNVVGKYLKNGAVRSCGCIKKHRCDLTGLKFGRLLVIKPNKKKSRCWDCLCECGKQCVVSSNQLKCGKTKSCGCLRKELAYNKCKKYNDYEIQEDYVIMYTSKGEPFYVDLEDFWKVKDICWHKNKNGYIAGALNGKSVRLHRLIMDAPRGRVVDHIHGKSTRNDNRKYNLRITTNQENCQNRPVSKDNTSGVTGVNWHKASNKWRAFIGINGKNIHLGSFTSLDEAIKARREAEDKYFGEWSYNNSQKRGINNG